MSELDDDVDKLKSGEHNEGNKGWAKVMRLGIRPDTLIHGACVTSTTGVDCQRGGSMHVASREVSSHLHGERFEQFGRSTRHDTV